MAGTPAAVRPAASSLLAVPESTISTTAIASGDVSRRPSMKRDSMCSAFSNRSTARPPPCTRTTGPSPRRTSVGERADEAGVLERRAADLVDTHAHWALPLRSGSPPSGLEGRDEAVRLRPAHREVQVLDRLSRRALHQVVEGGEDDGAAGSGCVHGDPAVVRLDHVRQARRSAVHHVDEGRAVVGGLERPLQLGEVGPRLHVEGGQDPALHRQQVRAEGQLDALAGAVGEDRLDLAHVPVGAARRVGREVLGDLAEEEVLARRAAGAGGAALGVRDDVGRVDEALAEKRDEGQEDRRGVAARVRDEPGATQAVPVRLAQAEDGLADQVRGLVVVAVPLLVALRGGEAEVAGEVDDDRLRPRLAQARGVGRGDAVGHREEVGVGRLVEPGLVGEMAGGAAGRECDPGARVAPEQAHQLLPRVARRPEDPDACAHFPLPPKENPPGSPGGFHESLDFGLGLVWRLRPPGGRASPHAGPGSHGGFHRHDDLE